MSLGTSIKYVIERGVTAEEISPNRYSLHVGGKRYSTLSHASEGYIFSFWDCTPGPGKDDFSITFSDLDSTLLAVWYFYFGDPVQVAEWKVPMHQQPSWSLGKVAYRIASAVHLNSAQFDAIAEARGRELIAPVSSTGGSVALESRYAIALRSQFIACPSAATEATTLMLRRDLEEAYLVADLR